MAESDLEVLDLEIDTSSASRTSVYPVIGKIISDDVLRSWEVIPLITKAWDERTYGGVYITYLEDNLYYFSFDCAASAEQVTRDGPWCIMGHFLCLRHWEAGLNVKEVSLTHVPIWVQLHGLRLDQMTEENARIIGDYIGKFMEMDRCSLNDALKRGFLRIKILLDCYRVIKGGMWVSRKSQTKYFINFKYERLADLCFNCGHFGHWERECKEESIPSHHFGLDLRATEASSWLENKRRMNKQSQIDEQRRRKKRNEMIEEYAPILLGIIAFGPLVGMFICLFIWMTIGLYQLQNDLKKI